jgi:hypothetical protein
MSGYDLADAARLMQADIHAALSANVSVTQALGNPVRAYDDPPEVPVYPYLTYGNVRSIDTSGDGAPQSTHQISLHLWSRYSGRSELLNLMRLVERALDDDMPHTVTPLYLDVFRAPDGITFHGLLRLSVTLSTTPIPSPTQEITP